MAFIYSICGRSVLQAKTKQKRWFEENVTFTQYPQALFLAFIRTHVLFYITFLRLSVVILRVHSMNCETVLSKDFWGYLVFSELPRGEHLLN